MQGNAEMKFCYQCPYLHSLGPNSVLQDDNSSPHRPGFIKYYFQNLGMERMEQLTSSSDLHSIKLTETRVNSKKKKKKEEDLTHEC